MRDDAASMCGDDDVWWGDEGCPCGDDPGWYYADGKGCSKVWEKPEARCKKKDEFKILGYEACPVACGRCEAGAPSRAWRSTVAVGNIGW